MFVNASFYENSTCSTGRINLSETPIFHNTLSQKKMLHVFGICQTIELWRTNVFCAFLEGGLTSSQVNNQPGTALQVPELLSTVGPRNCSHGNL